MHFQTRTLFLEESFGLRPVMSFDEALKLKASLPSPVIHPLAQSGSPVPAPPVVSQRAGYQLFIRDALIALALASAVVIILCFCEPNEPDESQ